MAEDDLGEIEELFSDIVRLEIVLFDHLDRHLRHTHDLPLTWFEPMSRVNASDRGFLRVQEIADELAITVGGASKIVDRLEGAGYVKRNADPGDGRISRVSLTVPGQRKLIQARRSLKSELARIVVPAASSSDRTQLHALIRRLLDAARRAT